MIAGFPAWPGTAAASSAPARNEEMRAGRTLGMTAAEARGRLRAIGARSRNLAACPDCGTKKGEPCPARPAYFHPGRFRAAAAAYASRRGCYPEDFGRVLALIYAAHPLPRPSEPETTPEDRIVLYRAHKANGAWLGRGSYWTHDRRWGELFLRVYEMGLTEAAALWRAEVSITDRNSYDQGRLGMTTSRLDRVLSDYPEWPGRSWLMFTGHPGEKIRGYPEDTMVQYVWCGKRPVKAEALGRGPGHACGRPAERAAAQHGRHGAAQHQIRHEIR